MAETLSGVNGGILRWARELYNIGIEEAAFSAGISGERYQAWENGTEFPTYSKLKSLSNLYRKPIAIFFFSYPPELPEIKCELRSLSSNVIDNLSKYVIKQFELAKIFQYNLYELYGERESFLNKATVDLSDIKTLCEELRSLLCFSLKAQKQRKDEKVVFEIFRERLYDIGIYTFKESFKDNTVSGLCVNDKIFPVIMVNNKMSFSRQTFTLFHEVYHLLSKMNGVAIINDEYYYYLDETQTISEKACDEFASEFLVPMEDFLLEIKNKPVSINLISELAKLYSVSREAIMYKFKNLGKIDSAFYNEAKTIFYGDIVRTKEDGKSGGNPYYTRLSYLGTQYVGEVFKAYFSGKIDTYKAGEFLNTKIDHLPKLETAFFRGNK